MGIRVQLAIPPGFISQLSKNRLDWFFRCPVSAIVDSLCLEVKVLSGNVQKGRYADCAWTGILSSMRRIWVRDTTFNYLMRATRSADG